MKRILFVLCVCVGNFVYSQQPYVPIRSNFLWGFADTLGNEVYPASFDFVSESVSKGFFIASKEGKYALFAYPNRVLIPFEYESINKISQHLVELKRNDSCFLYHVEKNKILPLSYTKISLLYSKNEALYEYEVDTKIGLLNYEGEILLKASFDSVYQKNKYLVFVKNGLHYIYKDHELLHPSQHRISYFMADTTIAVVCNKNNKRGLFFPYTGKAIDAKFERILLSYNNRNILILSNSNSVTFYNKVLDIESDQEYKDFNFLDSTRIIVSLNDSSSGIIDDRFNDVVPCTYKRVFSMWDDVICLSKGNTFNLFFLKTNEFLDKEYDNISTFNNGVSIVALENKYGLLNRFGVEIAPPIYTSFLKEGTTYTLKNKDHVLWILTDNQGRVEKERRFSQLETVSLTYNMNFSGTNLDSLFNERERRKPRLIDSSGVFEDPAERFYIERVSIGVLGKRIFGLRNYLTKEKITNLEYWNINLQDLKQSDYMTATLDGGRKVLLHYSGKTITTAKYWDGYRNLERPILRLDTFNLNGFSVFAAGVFRRQKLINNDVELPDDAKWGLLNAKGKAVIPAKFQEIVTYKNGYLICKGNNLFGVVNERGDTIVPFLYNEITFLEGSNESVFLVTKTNPKYGVVSSKGNELTNVVFKEIRPYSENFAAVRHPDFEGWNLINRKGEMVLATYYQRMNEFSEGLLAVRQKNKWGFIDSLGNVIIDFQYEQAGNFKNGLCYVKKFKEPGYVYIDKNQAVVLERFDRTYDFDRGLACVSKNGKLRLIDKTGKILFTFQSTKVYNYVYDWEAYQVLIDGNKITFFDSLGTVVLPNEKEAPIVSGFKSIRVGNKYGYINGYGNWLVKPKFVAAMDFSEDKAAVKVGSLWGFIDFTGDIKLKPQFKSLSSFHQNKAFGTTTKGIKQVISSTFEVSDTYVGETVTENNDLYTRSNNYRRNSDLDDDGRKLSVYTADGRKLFANSYHFIAAFESNLAIVANLHKTKQGVYKSLYGLINQYGYKKTPVIYDKITKDINGDYLVYKTTFSGIVDGNGQEIIPPLYEQIKKMPECNLYQVREGGKIGYINSKGEMIWEPKR